MQFAEENLKINSIRFKVPCSWTVFQLKKRYEGGYNPKTYEVIDYYQKRGSHVEQYFRVNEYV